MLATQASAQNFKTGLNAYDRGDFSTALMEWRPLAERGDARAQFNVGVILFNGQGVSHNPAEAVEWYRAAADQGYGPAQANLSCMYETGQGLLQNYIEAYKWSTLAARHGVEARKSLSSLSAKMTAEQIAEAEQAAAAWQPRLAETAPETAAATGGETVAQAVTAGPTRAQVSEVQNLLNALGFPAGPADGVAGPRTRAAVRNYQENAGAQVTGAIDEALIAQLIADLPVSSSEQIATRPPEEASPPPEPAQPPAVNTATARTQDCDELAAHPADELKPAGVFGVAFGDIDAERAIEACESALASSGGDMRYQLQLARSLHKAERLEEAVVYYQQAGLQGHPLAQKTLGFAYAAGLGVTQDYSKTAQWHQLAAEQGDIDAQNNMSTSGYLHAQGLGVRQDIVEAHMWYNIAAAYGSTRAADNRDLLASRMNEACLSG